MPKKTHDLLKNLAERRGLPIGRFCGDILMLQHCGNCRSVFRRKQPPEIVEELQGSLKAALDDVKVLQERNTALVGSLEDQEDLRSLEERNKTLGDSLGDWQVYCSTLQESNLSIQADSADLKRQNADLLAGTRNLEDSNAALQDEISQLRGTITSLEDQVAEGQLPCDLDIDEDEAVEGQKNSDTIVSKLRAALHLDGEDEGEDEGEEIEDLEGGPIIDLEY